MAVGLEIREAGTNDLLQLLELYTQFNNNPMPEPSDRLGGIWEDILSDRSHHVIIGLVHDHVVSSCVIVIIPNLTHEQRPYALIENVITSGAHRNRGHATALLNYAKDIALAENCYKIMLLTGSKEESILNFYRKAGYNSEDKTAFIHWL